MTKPASRFLNSIAKLAIGSIDKLELAVDAHYNPKELQSQRDVPWATRSQSHDAFDIEFTGSQPRTMDLEMLFDAYEQRGSVQAQLDVLEELASVRVPASKISDELRPHFCVVTWGEKGMRPLRCVITSLTTKVTMFDSDGTPRRAIANLKVREIRIDAREEANAEERIATVKRKVDSAPR
jgi:phage protein U